MEGKPSRNKFHRVLRRMQKVTTVLMAAPPKTGKRYKVGTIPGLTVARWAIWSGSKVVDITGDKPLDGMS